MAKKFKPLPFNAPGRLWEAALGHESYSHNGTMPIGSYRVKPDGTLICKVCNVK